VPLASAGAVVVSPAIRSRPATTGERRGGDDGVGLAADDCPAVDRLLLYLFYWLDFPLEEVAAVAGLSTSAARGRLYRAVGRLRLEFDPSKEKST
jgi:DNA-directed RNA polymerase specialized sigma24 family protein